MLDNEPGVKANGDKESGVSDSKVFGSSPLTLLRMLEGSMERRLVIGIACEKFSCSKKNVRLHQSQVFNINGLVYMVFGGKSALSFCIDSA